MMPVLTCSRHCHLIPRLAAIGLGALVACGGSQQSEPPAATSAPKPSPTAEAIHRTLPPLPAPAQFGVSAQHGGLVTQAGDMNVELVVSEGRARVYVYDAQGTLMGPAQASGTLTVDGKSYPLERRQEGLLVWLEGGESLPASFDAKLTLDLDGKAIEAELRYATGGTPESEPSAEE